jgi:hypothetical protein
VTERACLPVDERHGDDVLEAGGADADAAGERGIIPLQFASKFNFTLTGLQPYVGFDGGFYLLRPNGGNDSSEFGIAPKFGFRLPLAWGVDIDLNATYEVILDDPDERSYVGLNAGVAYIFGQ